MKYFVETPWRNHGLVIGTAAKSMEAAQSPSLKEDGLREGPGVFHFHDGLTCAGTFWP